MTPTKMPKRLNALLWLCYIWIALQVYILWDYAVSTSQDELTSLFMVASRLAGFALYLATVVFTRRKERAGWILLAGSFIFSSFFCALLLLLTDISFWSMAFGFLAVVYGESATKVEQMRHVGWWFGTALTTVFLILPLPFYYWALFSKKSLAYFGFETLPSTEHVLSGHRLVRHSLPQKMPLSDLVLSAILGGFIAVSSVAVFNEMTRIFPEMRRELREPQGQTEGPAT